MVIVMPLFSVDTKGPSLKKLHCFCEILPCVKLFRLPFQLLNVYSFENAKEAIIQKKLISTDSLTRDETTERYTQSNKNLEIFTAKVDVNVMYVFDVNMFLTSTVVSCLTNVA